MTERKMTEKKVLIAAPRGWCAGVERAVEIVERSLARYGAPVYVRKQIVHNLHVVRGLEGKGAVFVDSEDDVPEGEKGQRIAAGMASDIAVMEAMSLGAPVITSAVTSIPEIVEDAGILVDPLNEEGIFQALFQLSEDEQLRVRLKEKSVRQAKKFNWNAVARALLNCYEKVLTCDKIEEKIDLTSRSGKVGREGSTILHK